MKVIAYLNQILQLSDPSLLEYNQTMLRYNDPSGHPALRAAIAEFLTERANAPEPLDPDKVRLSYIYQIHVCWNTTRPC